MPTFGWRFLCLSSRDVQYLPILYSNCLVLMSRQCWLSIIGWKAVTLFLFSNVAMALGSILEILDWILQYNHHSLEVSFIEILKQFTKYTYLSLIYLDHLLLDYFFFIDFCSLQLLNSWLISSRLSSITGKATQGLWPCWMLRTWN